MQKFIADVLKYGFCKKSHFFPNAPLTKYPKVRKKLFNWSEVHSERSDFLQNPYFSIENVL